MFELSAENPRSSIGSMFGIDGASINASERGGRVDWVESRDG